MRPTRWKAAIIGAALLALTGCTALRATYDQAPRLAWWWLDGALDFADDLRDAVRAEVTEYFDWHRREQLPVYAAMLSRLQPRLLQPTTPEAVCALADEVRALLAPAVERAADDFAPFVATLGDEQFRALERKQRKSLEKLEKDFLQPDLRDRQAEAAKRARKHAERLYGRLGDEQLRLITASVAASPFDAERYVAERRRRQADLAQTLRRLAADGAGTDAHARALRQLWQRTESSDATYRSYEARVTAHNCRLAAELHNAATPAQRTHARDTVDGWIGDLRALAAEARG